MKIAIFSLILVLMSIGSVRVCAAVQESRQTKSISVKFELLESLRTDNRVKIIDADTVLVFSVFRAKKHDEKSKSAIRLCVENGVSLLPPNEVKKLHKEELTKIIKSYCDAMRAAGKIPKLWVQVSKSTKDDELKNLLIGFGKLGCSEIYVEELINIRNKKQTEQVAAPDS
ncbi:hypothetical protein HW115_19400 [Verrucomicrobiaceae bacterium N1E253]|uniref:Uncharacterized protein n=1 Tax=Oceaniferula marina TaxID=2748318 RepID=A0A851GTY9_9BACT|nr:hypothetical protein [Oceaniferula marina]NWK57794.1 hypothetical protein [Oceaniferula marina]